MTTRDRTRAGLLIALLVTSIGTCAASAPGRLIAAASHDRPPSQVLALPSPATSSASVTPDLNPSTVVPGASASPTAPTSVPAASPPPIRATPPAPLAVPPATTTLANTAGVASSGASTAIPAGNLPGWRLVYADDFNAPLDTVNAWTTYHTPGLSNTSTAWYSPTHLVISGGNLNIQGYVDTAAAADGRVVTDGLGLYKIPQQYGKWEVLARMDSCPDVKYVWMLWPPTSKWPDDGEVDFAEDEGGNRATTTATVIYAGAGDQRAQLSQDTLSPTPNFSAWHVIGLEWTPTSIRYTLDGQYWGSVKSSHLPQNPMALVLQTEGKVAPNQVTLGGGSCNAQIGWVVQYALAS